MGHASMHALGQQRPPKPGDNATLEEQLAYLTRYVEALSEELVATRAHARELIRAVERRLGNRIDKVSARVHQTNESLTSLRTA